MTTPEQRFKFNEVEEDGGAWVERCLSFGGCHVVNGLGKKSFSKPALTKDLLSGLVYEAVLIINRQNKFIGNLRGQAQILKTETINCQASVIKLQEELLASKDEQLGALQTSVKSAVESTVNSAVQDSVKTEFKSYSEAAQANLQTPNTSASSALNEAALINVVKNVVEEEDRSRNLMVFGLPEDDGEDKQLDSRVSAVFEKIGVKPRIESSRLGVKSSKSPRPIKVELSSSTVARQILLKAKNLRLSQEHKSIFVVPDRSIEQRARHKELVIDLKKRKAEDTSKRHYIKGGEICSVAITKK